MTTPAGGRTGRRSGGVFARAFHAEVAHLARSRWDLILLIVMPLVLLAVIAAMLFQGVMRDVPVAVVDQDHSSFSRAAIRDMQASAGIRVVAQPTDLEAAWSLMRSGRIYSVAYIPKGVERNAFRQSDAVIVYYNGAFQTVGSLASGAQTLALANAAAPMILARARAAGLPAADLKPPAVQVTLLGNPQLSFELFLGGLIAPGVLHLLMACAAVMGVGRELRGGSLKAWSARMDGRLIAALAGKLTPYVLVFTLWGLAWIAWLCGWRGWGIEGSLPMLTAGLIALMAATAALSALLIALTGDMDVSYSATAIYAGAAIAFSNGTLPLNHGPAFSQIWSAVLPFTHYLRLQSQQMVLGSDLSASLPSLLILSGVAVGAFALSVPLAHRLAGRDPKPEPIRLDLPPQSFGGAFLGAFAGIFRHRPLSSTLLLAVVAYAFYYPLAYAGQTPVKLPLAVADQDDSPLSRRLVREIDATQALDAVVVVRSPHEAERMMRNGRVDAVLNIPHDFQASLIHGDPKGVGLYLNGAYLVRATAMGKALAGAAAAAAEHTLSPLAEATRLAERAPTVVQRPLYNTAEGYGSYAVPAVSAIILQQTLLLGAALFAGLRREARSAPLGLAGFAGLWSALTLIGCMAGLFYFGFVFWFQDYPRMGDLAGVLVALPIFAAGVSALGLAIGSLFDRHERAMQILVGTSVPLFFLGGAAWPPFLMPQPLVWLAKLSPSTSAIPAFVKLNAAGATIPEVAPELLTLAALALLFGAVAAYRLTRRPSASR
ncbi:MAG: ABC transporter permease [Candidatus Brevundimonas colombiensis]|uniref:ABC transporter permease n=1 Tax=Candidatus Brevundimonas colombiensis TaxID=3121376 RepID=A0AAJ5X241_9CAUL|nr:ABC transporter permease [Brevundimonas sp.]WEK38775.1 MAG: ABC transporter permease [Brevundimonas sp.]